MVSKKEKNWLSKASLNENSSRKEKEKIKEKSANELSSKVVILWFQKNLKKKNWETFQWKRKGSELIGNWVAIEI